MTPGIQFCQTGYSPLFDSPNGPCTNLADALLTRIDGADPAGGEGDGGEDEEGGSAALVVFAVFAGVGVVGAAGFVGYRKRQDTVTTKAFKTDVSSMI